MNIQASIAGIVFKVLVRKGEMVRKGQEVAIIESMKMQIPVVSELSGTVEQIKLKDGDFVNEGDVILTLG